MDGITENVVRGIPKRVGGEGQGTSEGGEMWGFVKCKKIMWGYCVKIIDWIFFGRQIQWKLGQKQAKSGK